ncbi:MAG TPA: EcsC family protein [Candidatus Limnocylindrales bacterium]|nr:EcsC family protein [Candidatus Limnocylindrales bacterium]
MRPRSSDWIYRFIRASARAGFRRAYEQVQLDPDKYLRQVRRNLQVPVRSWQELQVVSDGDLDPHADHIIRSSSRAAALEGLGLGFGGLLTVLPDFGILATITIRMLQKLSLTYGFEYSTSHELASLWLAAASAAGLDYGREFLEKQAVERVVPRIVDQVALRAGADVAEKWAARVLPIVSAGTAGALNYWFVRSWGRRAKKHFLERRSRSRLQLAGAPIPIRRDRPALPSASPVATSPAKP